MAAPMKDLVLIIFLIFFICTRIEAVKDTFYEELFVKPLESGHLYNHFQFTTTWGVDLYDTSQCKSPVVSRLILFFLLLVSTKFTSFTLSPKNG